jgi:hypothetical protein
MKRTIILTVTMAVLCPFEIMAQKINRPDMPAQANKQQPAAQITQQAGRPGFPKILSPFYLREAESYTEGNIHYVNSDVAFELTSNDVGGTGLNRIEYAVDGGPFKTYSSPFKIKEEGNHLIRYRGIDNSNNVEKTELYQVYVDNTPPFVLVGTDRGLYKKDGYYYCSNNIKLYIEAEDSGSGVRQTYAGTSIDKMIARGTGVSSEANFFHVAEAEGPYEFYFTAIDNVGNMADIKKYNIIVDNTPPVVDIDKSGWISMDAAGMQMDKNTHIGRNAFIIVPNPLGGPNSFYVNGNYQVGFMAADPKIGMLDGSGVSAIYCKVNDEQFLRYKGPIKFEKEKTYRITVKAEDNVGNFSKEVTYTFTLDFERPESSINVMNSKGETVRERTAPPKGK